LRVHQGRRYFMLLAGMGMSELKMFHQILERGVLHELAEVGIRV
jgi:hypothetical protein